MPETAAKPPDGHQLKCGEQQKSGAGVCLLKKNGTNHQENQGNRGMDKTSIGSSRSLRHIEAVIREQAGVGYADKKKYFFQRQIDDFNTRQIPAVETPHAHVGKVCVPRKEKEKGQ